MGTVGGGLGAGLGGGLGTEGLGGGLGAGLGGLGEPLVRVSSGYAPPEAVWVNEDTYRAILRLSLLGGRQEAAGGVYNAVGAAGAGAWGATDLPSSSSSPAVGRGRDGRALRPGRGSSHRPAPAPAHAPATASEEEDEDGNSDSDNAMRSPTKRPPAPPPPPLRAHPSYDVWGLGCVLYQVKPLYSPIQPLASPV